MFHHNILQCTKQGKLPRVFYFYKRTVLITVPIIETPMTLAESSLNIEQVSLMKHKHIEKMHFGTEKIVLIANVYLISSGLNSGMFL